jgi:hypothetical protein
VQTLLRQIRRPRIGGEEMPVVFEQLAHMGCNSRRGEITLIVGQPAAGKSAVALWLALQWVARHGQRGIYWSADAAPFVAAARTAAALGAGQYRDVERMLRDKDPRAIGPLSKVSKAGLEWVFDASIDVDSLELNMDGFLEKWGGHPDFVIVDNLTDVDTGREGDEFSGLRGMMRDLNFMGRKTQAAMVVLHHTSESEKEDPLPPRKATHGKVAVKPTIIIGTARGEGNTKPMGPLKNRYGFEDKTGHSAELFHFDPDTFQFDGSIGRVLGKS